MDWIIPLVLVYAVVAYLPLWITASRWIIYVAFVLAGSAAVLIFYVPVRLWKNQIWKIMHFRDERVEDG